MSATLAGLGCYLITTGALLALSVWLDERRRVDVWRARVDRLQALKGGTA